MIIYGENMSKKDDVSKLYDIVISCKKIINFTFYLNIILSFVLIYLISSEILNLQLITIFLNILVSFLSDFIFFPKSEEERLRSNIKNSLGVDVTENDTDGYYNNKQQHSIQKVILNTFENIFFTKNIVNKMLFKDWIKPFISVVLLTVAFVFFRERSIILIVFQSIFSSNYLIGYIKLCIFKVKLDVLFSKFRSKLKTEDRKGGVNSLTKEELVILITESVEYEMLKSSFKVMLDSKVFKENNEKWSNEWNEMAETIVVSKNKFN